MNIAEKIAFSWVGACVFIESFFPWYAHEDKMQAAFLTSLCVAFMLNAHGIIFQKVKKLVTKS